MSKDAKLSIRISTEDLENIKRRAKQARMSQGSYVAHCCLGRQVVVIEDLEEVLKQLRAIGNNLNRLTVLADMGRISAVNLGRTADGLAGISAALRELQERRRWKP